MSTSYSAKELPTLVRLAHQALRKAAAGVIAEHRKTGRPLIVWLNGQVTLVDADSVDLPTPSDQLVVHEGS